MNAQGIVRPRKGHFYLDLWREMKEQLTEGDAQRDAVYAWEKSLLDHEPLVQGAFTQASVRDAAAVYLEHLWTKYSPRFDPYFPGLPYLRIESFKRVAMQSPYTKRRRRTSSAHARVYTHTIYLTHGGLSRQALVHEVAHLLTWRDRHGPTFCGA